MRLKQLSVFLENCQGQLEKVCRLIADAGVNLETITIAETKDYGILRAIVDKPDEATAALKSGGFFAKEIEVLAVDKPGALLKILEKTSEAGLNIEYMYALTRPFDKKPVMVMSFKDIGLAESLLQ